MAKIFITGSADGLGQLAARALIKLGHQVVLHARNADLGIFDAVIHNAGIYESRMDLYPLTLSF